MPARIQLPPHVFPPTSKENLKYADLAIIDLSKATSKEGRLQLAPQVSRALKEEGFFYAVNHGYTQEQTDRVFSIANVLFDGVSEDEKKLYTGQSNTVYEGYKPRQAWRLVDGVFDQIEHYNMNRHVKMIAHPEPVRPFLKDLEDFAHHNHFQILHPILRLLALGMNLDEETLVKQHSFESPGESSARFMKYFPRSVEEETKTSNVWLKGHCDIGSVTILWSQPVSGLQILAKEGEWRWVKHIPNALVINMGDVIEFLCGGYYPATKHRVVQPPLDQRGLPRLGVFYFSMADDDVKLVPHEESSVLQTVGVRLWDNDEAPTMREWRETRTSSYGRSLLKKNEKENVEEEVISGVVVKHYN